MSEYQYYEFQAVDRQLSQQEMAELRALSTRATITPTRFVNHYEWGNFRGDSAKLMDRYFDIFVYVANWGTHELMLRLPRRLLDLETAAHFLDGDWAKARVADHYVILEFTSEDDEGDYREDDDGTGWLASLLPLRADLASGDLRCLYLAWLSSIQGVEPDDDAVEPPVPPGLGSLSAALQTFAQFLRIDEDLIAVAAEGSALLGDPLLSKDELAQWIGSLAVSEKNELLLLLVEGGDPSLRAELLQRFRRLKAPTPGDAGDAHAGARTAGQLIEAAEQHRATRIREEAQREARERVRKEREEAAARAAYLDQFAAREAEAWEQFDALVQTPRGTEYAQAVQLLVDLRDLHARSGRADAFFARMHHLRDQHARKPGLIARFDRAHLGSGTGALDRTKR